MTTGKVDLLLVKRLQRVKDLISLLREWDKDSNAHLSRELLGDGGGQ